MKITIKQPALDFLRQLNFPHGIAVRIAAVMSGGCGCTYDIHLLQDSWNEQDTVIYSGDIPFCINPQTAFYLGDEFILQYQPASGFTLSSPNEILGTKLSIALVP